MEAPHVSSTPRDHDLEVFRVEDHRSIFRAIEARHEFQQVSAQRALTEGWLKLAEGVGFSRDYVLSTKGILSATRFSVDAYVHFVSERTLLEAIASSLTEMFSPTTLPK